MSSPSVAAVWSQIQVKHLWLFVLNLVKGQRYIKMKIKNKNFDLQNFHYFMNSIPWAAALLYWQGRHKAPSHRINYFELLINNSSISYFPE